MIECKYCGGDSIDGCCVDCRLLGLDEPNELQEGVELEDDADDCESALRNAWEGDDDDTDD